MSSFNKRFRRANKERAQPAHRAKYGLLEKKKDYRKRARDYNAKRAQLKELQLQAALRNPDEFAFHMQNSAMKDGAHVELVKSTQTPQQLAQLSTHDLAYLTMTRQHEERAVERLRNEAQFLGAEKPKSHIVFVDSDDEIMAFDPAKYFDTATELVGRFHNRPRLEHLEEVDYEQDADELGKRKRETYKELESRMKRKATLDAMLGKVELQRKLRAKGGPVHVVKDKETGASLHTWAPRRRK